MLDFVNSFPKINLQVTRRGVKNGANQRSKPAYLKPLAPLRRAARDRRKDYTGVGFGGGQSLTSWTLQPKTMRQTKTKTKDLPAANEPQLDKVTIVSNSLEDDAAPRRKRKKLGVLFTADDIASFFAAITSLRDRAIFRLMYHAGLRASEVGTLLMRHWDARTERIHVTRLKGSNSGAHRLNREESRALKAWLKVRGSVPGPIFPSRERSPISRKMLWVLVGKYVKLAGLPSELGHPHAFKHACCTHLLERGFRVEQVQDWVGHANIANTMKYSHVTNPARDRMAEELSEWK